MQVRLELLFRDENEARKAADDLAARYVTRTMPMPAVPWYGASVHLVSDDRVQLEATILKTADYFLRSE